MTFSDYDEDAGYLIELLGWKNLARQHEIEIACSKRSDSGERCEVKKGMKSRGGLGREVPTSPPPSLLFFRAPFTSHRSPLSERLEQARN